MAKVSQYPVDSDFIVRVSSQPGGYHYVKIAILEVDQGVTSAAAISERCKGVRSIARDYGDYPWGKTAKSSGWQAHDRAVALCAELNAAQIRRRKAAATREANRRAKAENEAEQAQDAIALAY
jgi:hypothetical protein